MPRKKSRKSVAATADDAPKASTSAAVGNGSSSSSGNVERRNKTCMQQERLKRTDPPPPQPTGITLETSPMRHSASNRKEGEPQTRAYIDVALKEELWDARYLTDDLNDLMFRSHISTELARDVLQGLLGANVLTVRKVVGKKVQVIRKGNPDAATAIKNAYERALVHGCQRSGIDQVKSPSKPRDRDRVSWNWTWNDFPKAPLQEGALVDFLNKIVDTALRLPCMKQRKPLYRFALPHDRTRAYPLSHAPDKADFRPDFVVLPIAAFDVKQPKRKGQLPVYEPKKEWNNFTMVKLTGECKNSDEASGVYQVQGYMRATRRAQPWLRFVTAMVVTREVVNFVRGDASGMERVKMRLEHGRSCLEFVRLLLAVVCCEAELFGKSSRIGLTTQAITSQVAVPETSPAVVGQAQVPFSGDAAPTPAAQGSSQRILRSSVRNPATQLPPPNAHAPRPSLGAPQLTASSTAHATRSSEKRKRNSEDDANLMPPPAAKKEADEEVEFAVQVPTTVFGIFEYDGLLFTGASIRGRGTVVFVVHRKDTPQVKIALKMAWQDVARKPRRDEVMEILSKNPHEHVLLPISVQVEEDSTLRIIRAFTQSEVNAGDMRIEDRVLEVHEMELRRPVRYFWSVQDFVQGLRGALLGHQYLVEINILHRDVSENNVVLACRPGQPRGAVIDFDMAIRYEGPSLQELLGPTDIMRDDTPPHEPSPISHHGPFRAERTGTTPYMAIDVLDGVAHTHYDDIESFFYVLLLFFFSYNGPLSTNELEHAHEHGFTHPLRSVRAKNMTDWPDMFHTWSASMRAASDSKFALLSRKKSAPMVTQITSELKTLWGTRYRPIGALISRCLVLFQDRAPDNRVTHAEFIEALDTWLEAYPEPLENSCPFADSEGRQHV